MSKEIEILILKSLLSINELLLLEVRSSISGTIDSTLPLFNTSKLIDELTEYLNDKYPHWRIK